ncbi:GNAT family N-acetyltransferase [Hymenobacter arizonensis]|uniref:Ribosomal-protein-alanine N-acetyltransferase n=1 Tax=Hymenobacter arizonensis TaxID=1227077 RepID=A0A1I6AJU4_HYMAR|nr:GNAT family N-acetyltransferase [Hymenobacter arizonensis]SFQ68767.1 ribosomal-protein-alanine N-acetyltransferase [Hymenobacter arizonensis]
MTDKKFTPFPVLKTGRLTLRQLRRSDDQAIWALRSNEHVNHYLSRQPSQSLDDARNFIDTITENVQRGTSIYWAIALRRADNVIGTVCLFNFSENLSTAELGYELLPDFQGKGFMHEALATVLHFGFQQVGLQTVEAYTHFENHRSTLVLEKLLFTKDSAADENFTRFHLTHSG